MPWPREAVAFLQELEAENTREWFKANRARYDHSIVAPTRALAETLTDFGRAHLFRPYRDTRFHPGPPIKEQVGLALGYEGAGGFYVELSLDGLLVAAGLHNPRRDQVERLRSAVDDERRAPGLRAAIAETRTSGLALDPPALKRGPRGFAPDHPSADLLRHRALTVSQRHELGAWVHEPEADQCLREQLESARPFVRWIRENVGAPQAR